MHSRGVSCASLPPRKTKLAGISDVDVGIEVAVPTLVACDSVDEALTCHWAVACRFACGRTRACGQQDWLQHHEHLLRTKRKSDGSCLYIRSEGSVEFLFRPSDRHPDVSTSSIEAAFLRGLTTKTNGSTVTKLRVSRKFSTIWPMLHRLSIEPDCPSSELRTTTLRTRIHLTLWNKKPRAPCVLERAPVLVSCFFSLPALGNHLPCGAGLAYLR